MATSVQVTAQMHAKMKRALTKAMDMLENQLPVPWDELEEAIDLAKSNGLATSEDVQSVRDRSLDIPRMKQIFHNIQKGYGNGPKKPPVI